MTTPPFSAPMSLDANFKYLLQAVMEKTADVERLKVRSNEKYWIEPHNATLKFPSTTKNVVFAIRDTTSGNYSISRGKCVIQTGEFTPQKEFLITLAGVPPFLLRDDIGVTLTLSNIPEQPLDFASFGMPCSSSPTVPFLLPPPFPPALVTHVRDRMEEVKGTINTAPPAIELKVAEPKSPQPVEKTSRKRMNSDDFKKLQERFISRLKKEMETYDGHESHASVITTIARKQDLTNVPKFRTYLQGQEKELKRNSSQEFYDEEAKLSMESARTSISWYLESFASKKKRISAASRKRRSKRMREEEESSPKKSKKKDKKSSRRSKKKQKKQKKEKDTGEVEAHEEEGDQEGGTRTESDPE